VPFAYEGPPADGELRQGEILASIVDYRTENAAAMFGGADPIVTPRLHARMAIVTSDCDLLKDHQTRHTAQPWNAAHLIEHVLLCDVYTEAELEAAGLPAAFGTKEWRQLRGNKMERYHRFPAAAVPGGQALPEIFLDFKRCIGVPPETLYEAIGANQVSRIARLPPVFLQDLTHRFYGFLSRVGPDFE
jgi:hypothetical protein